MTASPDPGTPAVIHVTEADGDNGAGGRSYGLLGRAVAEAAGAALLVFIGLGLTIFSTQGGITPPLGFGLGLAAAMVAFGYVSGGHFNPAVTLAVATAGRLPWLFVPAYIGAQLVGAIFGTFVLWAALSGYPGVAEPGQIFAQAVNSFGEDTALAFPLAGSLLLEVIAAALLTAVFLGATARAGERSGAAPFAVGVSYAVLLSVLAPITGGGLNPARSTAPVLFGDFTGADQLWVFWVAPLVGALITGLIYRSIDLSRTGALRGNRTEGTVGEDMDDADAGAQGAGAYASDEAPATGRDLDGSGTGTAAGAGPRGVSDPGTTPASTAAGTGATAATGDDEARSFFDGPEDGGHGNNHGDDHGGDDGAGGGSARR